MLSKTLFFKQYPQFQETYLQNSEKNCLMVNSHEQKLWLLKKYCPIKSYAISTAKKGLGEGEGSLKTPRGLHQIKEKIGEALPLGAILKGRVYTGKKWCAQENSSPEDLVLTRILWLDGLEPHNQNSSQRYIYIHGTNHPAKIGQAASHGCIRMGDRDLIQLFNRVSVGDLVYII